MLLLVKYQSIFCTYEVKNSLNKPPPSIPASVIPNSSINLIDTGFLRSDPNLFSCSKPSSKTFVRRIVTRVRSEKL